MKRLILLASLGLLAGCNLAPKYNRPPDSATPAAFKEATPVDPQVGFRLAQPSDQRMRGAWWEVYDDPVLNQLEVRVATELLAHYESHLPKGEIVLLISDRGD